MHVVKDGLTTVSSCTLLPMTSEVFDYLYRQRGYFHIGNDLKML